MLSNGLSQKMLVVGADALEQNRRQGKCWRPGARDVEEARLLDTKPLTGATENKFGMTVVG